jgi:homoserine acetyltransferase
MTWPTQQGTYDRGDVTLQSSARLPAARLSWKTHGTLSPNQDNVIVYPTSYGAQHPDLEWLIGPDKILDPTRWFIVIPDMFGNGLSSSPSDTSDYPTLVTVHDNVQVQRHALKDLFGIDRVACVYGWSMGALQAYHWACAAASRGRRVRNEQLTAWTSCAKDEGGPLGIGFQEQVPNQSKRQRSKDVVVSVGSKVRSKIRAGEHPRDERE